MYGYKLVAFFYVKLTTLVVIFRINEVELQSSEGYSVGGEK